MAVINIKGYIVLFPKLSTHCKARSYVQTLLLGAQFLELDLK